MMQKALACVLMLLVLAWTSPTHLAAGDLLGERFEEFTGIPRAAAQPLSDSEMEELRGGFLGFFFSVNFAGFVQPGGVMDANLTVNAGLTDNSGTQSDGFTFGTGGGTPGTVASGSGIAGSRVATVTNPITGETFRVAAVIDGGAFANSNTIASISQVPGNMNNIRQALVINLAIIQARESEFSALRARLAPMFGLTP